MRKEVKISTKLDTSDFDKSVEQMQRRLKDLYAPSDMIRMQQQTSQRLNQMGMPGNMSSPGTAAYQQASQQSRRELDQLIQTESRRQEKMVKNITERERILKNLQAIEKAGVKDAEQELLLKEKILRVEKNIQREKESYANRDSAINQLMDIKQSMAPKGMDRLMEAYRNGGMGGAAGAAGSMAKANWPSLVSLLGTALTGGSDLYRDIGGMPLRTDVSTGNAVSGIYGRDVQNVYGRRSAFEMMYQPERSRAANQALEKMRTDKNADMAGLAGNTALIAGGTGTALGTGVTGVGLVAGLATAITGMFRLFSDERQRSLLLSPVSDSSKNRYQSLQAEQLAKDYNESYEAQKRQNPFKTAAVEEYQQNFMRNLDAQRSMGMSNNQFYGGGPGIGYMQQGINAGFTPEMMMQMSQGIMGAGGSTRMARNSVFGLQMQKNMDLTNAGQILGTLSGSVGGADATKQATMKIISEAMKLGLDSSQFAEENRRFTQAAAEVVSRTGANKETDFERIAAGLSRYMGTGDNTNTGISAARSAYEQYQQMSSTTTGARGTMRYAGFMGDKDLSKLSVIEKQALAQVKEEDLNENNPLFANAMQKTGLSAEELSGRIGGINRKSVSRFGDFDTRIERLRKGMKDYGLTELNTETIKKLPKELQSDYGMVSSYYATEQGYTGSKELQSAIAGQVGPNKMPRYVTPFKEAEARAKLEGESGRMEDNTVKAMAADSGTVLKNFNEMRGSMDEAAKSAAQFTDKVRELNAELMKALEDSRSGSGDKSAIENVLKKLSAPIQPQSGKARK